MADNKNDQQKTEAKEGSHKSYLEKMKAKLKIRRKTAKTKK